MDNSLLHIYIHIRTDRSIHLIARVLTFLEPLISFFKNLSTYVSFVSSPQKNADIIWHIILRAFTHHPEIHWYAPG